MWVDTDAALDKFNIGHAEVTVLIGMQVVHLCYWHDCREPGGYGFLTLCELNNRSTIQHLIISLSLILCPSTEFHTVHL